MKTIQWTKLVLNQNTLVHYLSLPVGGHAKQWGALLKMDILLHSFISFIVYTYAEFPMGDHIVKNGC